MSVAFEVFFSLWASKGYVWITPIFMLIQIKLSAGRKLPGIGLDQYFGPIVYMGGIQYKKRPMYWSSIGVYSR